jgi:hypothetical protein
MGGTWSTYGRDERCILVPSGTWIWGHWLDRAGQEYVNMEGTCKCGNDASGSIKCRELLDWLEIVQLFKIKMFHIVSKYVIKSICRYSIHQPTNGLKLKTNWYLDTPRNRHKSDNSMINSSHNDIADNVQADFVHVFYIILLYFTKILISRILPKNVRIIHEERSKNIHLSKLRDRI